MASTRVPAEYKYSAIRRKRKLLLFLWADQHKITKIPTSFIAITCRLEERELVGSTLNTMLLMRGAVVVATLIISSNGLLSISAWLVSGTVPKYKVLHSF